MVAKTLGPYKIIEQLGAGGMGEVYLGEDTRLGRKVAIKVLLDEFASDPERLARFEQEARAAAALNHPHIAAVFDVGSAVAGGSDPGRSVDAEETGAQPESEATTAGHVTHYMVQEHLEGDTIGAALDEGRLPLKTALLYAAEIAEALTAAHGAGIVHRDLKPANVFVTKDGHAKVLDFGLAKLTDVTTGTTSGSGETVTAMAAQSQRSPSMLGTVAGQVMGTAGYMAPEQVEGAGDVDARADIFAFGCLLYEMTTGKKAFTGRSTVEILQRIAHEEPEQSIGDIDGALPADLDRIVRKCLVKERDGRYQHADDVLVDVRALRADVEAETAAPIAAAEAAPAETVTSGISLVAAGVGAVIVAGAAGLAGWYLAGSGPAPQPEVSAFILEADVSTFSFGRAVAISPDGRTVVYSRGAPPQLYVRHLDDLRSAPLTGTENGLNPFFSPEGDWIGFYATTEQKLKKVPVGGGQAFELADGVFIFGAWSDEDTIVFGSLGSGLRSLPAIGGDERVLIADPEVTTRVSDVFPRGGAALVDLRAGGVAIVDLADGEYSTLLEDGSGAKYVGSGHLVYTRQNELWAVRFDLSTLQIIGQPVPAIQGVRESQFNVSENGTLVYLPATVGAGSGDELIVWLDRDGDQEATAAPLGDFRTPLSVSPNGSRAAAIREGDDGTAAIHVYDLRQGIDVRLSDTGELTAPVWSPDGESVFFGARVGDRYVIHRQLVRFPDGAPEVLAELERMPIVTSVAPSGDTLLFDAVQDERAALIARDVFSLSLEQGAAPEPLLATAADERWAVFSPDGNDVAFQMRNVASAEGRTTATFGWAQVFVRDLASRETFPVSPGPGNNPRWSASGDRIMFERGRALLSAEIDFAADGFAVGTVEEIFRFPPSSSTLYDLSRDGRILTTALPAGPSSDDASSASSLQRVYIVQNFFGRLRELLPEGER